MFKSDYHDMLCEKGRYAVCPFHSVYLPDSCQSPLG